MKNKEDKIWQFSMGILLVAILTGGYIIANLYLPDETTKQLLICQKEKQDLQILKDQIDDDRFKCFVDKFYQR